ncbi:Serine protease pic autotransporter precursor [Achromobacter ruhlandii]|nr:Serine protease pic autotransporter precursor [Achromobacter ruhlandii]
MNKIHSLKYNHQNQLVAVSEVCSGRKRGSATGSTRRARAKGQRARLGIALRLIAASLSPGAAYASYVSIDIPYQTYRDFAENKGAFQPGALGVPIYNKSGQLRGRLSDTIPFIDFSSVSDDKAIETLIAPQYAVGVAHNSRYDTTRFAGTEYFQIRRDVHPGYDPTIASEYDFDINRMGKLVTDAAPVATSALSKASTPSLSATSPDLWTEEDKQRFPLFYRVGTGRQLVGNHPEKGHDPRLASLEAGLHELDYAYAWATGGIITPTWSNDTFVIAAGDNGLLPSYVQDGDSGSPLLAWDARQKQWVLAGTSAHLTLIPGRPAYAYWSHVFQDYLASVLAKDNDPDVTFAEGKGPLLWSFDRGQGSGRLTQQDRVFLMHGYRKTPGFAPANGGSELDFDGLDAGKNLSFRVESGKGKGEITLQDSVHQGAGALTFHDSFTVSPSTDQTWMGAGIDVKENVTVTWRVNGVAGDNLHKVGPGTLIIAGKGANPGGLRLGDGKVVLTQQPDVGGKVQAFDSVTLSSGRAELVLGDARQVDPDRIQWGTRGGLLDINGNDITFNQLPDNAKDHGATIANRAARKATVEVNLKPVGPAAVVDYIIMPSRAGTGLRGDLYKRGVNYFVLKQNTFATVPAPASQTSDEYWEYAGQFLGTALDKANERKREYFPARTAFIFAGTLKDNIDVNIANQTNTIFIADGDIAIGDNTLSARQGELVFQGHPVIHATNTPDAAQKLRDLGDDSVKTQSVSFDQPDWESRHFTLGNLALTDATFHLARNAALLGDIDAHRARVILGSPLLYINRNDGGPLAQEPERGASIASTDADKSRYQGKITLKEKSTLEIRELFDGAIDASDSAITVFSDQAALTGHSRFAGSALTMENGAHLKASGGWYDDGTVTVADGAALTLSGAPAGLAHYFTQAIALQGDNANLHLAPGSHSFSDLSSTAASRIALGPSTAADAPATVYAGSANAALASMRIHDNAHWIVTGDSTLKQLHASKALLSFDDMDRTRNEFLAQAQSASALALAVNASPTAAIQPAYSLTADTLAASNSTFSFRVDPYGGDHDRLTVTTALSGSGNTLRVAAFGDRPATATPRARETLLLDAPSSAPTDLFQLEQAGTDTAAADGNPWLGGLAISHDAGQRQWWFISMRNDAPWQLTRNRQFDALHLPTGGRVELSQPQADWTPRTLQTDTLTANGVHFPLTARPQTGESDSIRIATLAQGGDNSLDLTLLVQNPVPDSGNGSLLLASAPLTTADGYFKAGSITQGLTVYVPNVEIVSADARKKWQLAYRKVGGDVIAPPVPPAGSGDTPVDATPPTVDTTPPVIDTTPPVVDTTPPVVDTTPPVVDTTPPVVDTRPPVVDTTPPVVDTRPPVVDTTPPVVDTTPPVVDTTPPVVDTTPPVVDTTPPVVDTTPPVVDTTPPVVDTTPPVVDTTPPAVDTTPPVVDTTPPVVDTTPPAVDTTPPVADTTPPAVDTTPPVVDTTPPVVDTTPPVVDTTPPAVDTPPPVVDTTPPVAGTTPPAIDTPPPVVDTTPGAAQPGTGGPSLFTPFALKLSELDALQSREQIAHRLTQAGIAADDGAIGQVTQLRQQIIRTSALASLPRVSFVLETNQLNKRLGDVRQLNEDAGLWIKTSHGRADYQQIRLKHATLQFGLDRKQGRQLYGVMGSYTQGSGQGEGQLSERHTTGGIGLYYALIHEDGPFVDIIAKYLKTNQNYHLPSHLDIAAQGARSTSLLASVQAGWRQSLFNDRAFIEPSVEVVAGSTSGYTLHGASNSVDVRVNASKPVYAKIGAAIGLNMQSDDQHAVAVSAGLFRLQNLRRGGSIDILNNGNPDDMLRNPMADDSRYLINLSVNARLSANWRLYSQVESSFAGKLKHDYNGQIGVRYQF